MSAIILLLAITVIAACRSRSVRRPVRRYLKKRIRAYRKAHFGPRPGMKTKVASRLK